MAVHHSLGVAGGARGEKHGGHIVGLTLGNFIFKEFGVFGGEYSAIFYQHVKRLESGFRIAAQAARVAVDDVLKQWALISNFQQLVHLLLVFHQGQLHLGVVDGKHTLAAHGVLVERHRNSA